MRILLLASAAFLMACSAEAQKSDYGPPSEVQEIYTIASEPSADRIRADIQTLADFGTRHTLSETQSETRGIGAARRWIFAEFEKISEECGGCLEVIYVSDTVSGERRIPDPTDVVSVLAIQKGEIDPNRYVMMSGDIDSRVTDPLNGTDDSPGANDNASGMAGTIEAARILSKRKFAGSIIYAGLSGEEQGLFGGKIVADYALKEGWEIKGVLNNDMISNIAGIDGVINNSTVRVFSEGTRANETEAEARARRFTGGEVDSPSRNLARYIKAMGTHEHYDRQHQDLRLEAGVAIHVSKFGNEIGLSKADIILGLGDAISTSEEDKQVYEAKGFNADYVVKHEGLPDGGDDLLEEMNVKTPNKSFPLHEVADITRHYIAYGDTMEGVDANYAAKLTALNMVTMAGMAGAPPFPANVEASGAVQPSAKLTWETPENADNLAGYRVHWRLTTAPEWTHSRFIGKVNEWEFTNLVIDNYFFGVSAVAKDGSETPVVFPGAAGRF